MGVSEAVRNPRSYLGEKQRMYRILLFDPDRFYEEHVGDRGLRTEVLLVAVVGAVGAIGTLYAVQAILGEFDTGITGDLEWGVEMPLWGEALRPIATAFALWIAFTAALYALSWLYSNAGTGFRLLKKTAWSFAPLLLANALSSIAYVVTVWGADIDTQIPGGTTQTRYLFLWEQVAHEPLVIAAEAAAIPFALWAGYIAAAAVADERALDRGEAYRVVAVPVVLYVLYVAYQIVGIL